jgi:hypothetical protein
MKSGKQKNYQAKINLKPHNKNRQVEFAIAAI